MKKRRSRKDERIDFLTNGLENNGRAIDTQSKLKWTVHDLKSIRAQTGPQKDMFRAYFNGANIIASGSAGTGKTFAAMYLALTTALSEPGMQIKIVRSIVETRQIGFLKGDKDDKMAPYEKVYSEILCELIGPRTYDNMKEAGLIEFVPTSYIRGRTWNDSIVVVDELQNMNLHEIDTIMTRVGTNSRILVVGDNIQSDLIHDRNDVSGMPEFLKIVKNMGDEFEHVIFTSDDCVRSEFVKTWMKARESTYPTDNVASLRGIKGVIHNAA